MKQEERNDKFISINDKQITYEEVQQLYSTCTHIALQRTFKAEDIKFVTDQTLSDVLHRQTFDDIKQMNHCFFESLAHHCNERWKGAGGSKVKYLQTLYDAFLASSIVTKVISFTDVAPDAYQSAMNDLIWLCDTLTDKKAIAEASLLMEIIAALNNAYNKPK